MTEQEEIKLCAARYIYRGGLSSVPTYRSGTWAQWFEKKYGENYYEYVKKMTRKKK